MVTSVFKSRIFPIKNIIIDNDYYVYDDEFNLPKSLTTQSVVLDSQPLPRASPQGRGIKILPSKQLLQRFPILLVQLKLVMHQSLF